MEKAKESTPVKVQDTAIREKYEVKELSVRILCRNGVPQFMIEGGTNLSFKRIVPASASDIEEVFAARAAIAQS